MYHTGSLQHCSFTKQLSSTNSHTCPIISLLLCRIVERVCKHLSKHFCPDIHVWDSNCLKSFITSTKVSLQQIRPGSPEARSGLVGTPLIALNSSLTSLTLGSVLRLTLTFHNFSNNSCKVRKAFSLILAFYPVAFGYAVTFRNRGIAKVNQWKLNTRCYMFATTTFGIFEQRARTSLAMQVEGSTKEKGRPTSSPTNKKQNNQTTEPNWQPAKQQWQQRCRNSSSMIKHPLAKGRHQQQTSTYIITHQLNYLTNQKWPESRWVSPGSGPKDRDPNTPLRGRRFFVDLWWSASHMPPKSRWIPSDFQSAHPASTFPI